MTLTGDTFSGNPAPESGGGLFNGGTATLTTDTFTGNPASDGGGLFNDATATLTGDTFTGNSATDGGGGLTTSRATVTLTNDTITDNSATDGGGLDNTGTATLYNTIVAGNYVSGPSYSDSTPSEIAGTVSGSNNLIGDPNSAGGLTNGSDGNIVGIGGVSPIPLSTIFATDANGIPCWPTTAGRRRPSPWSRAAPPSTRGARACPTIQYIDQRGFPRVGRPTSAPSRARGSI